MDVPWIIYLLDVRKIPGVLLFTSSKLRTCAHSLLYTAIIIVLHVHACYVDTDVEAI